MNENKEGRLIVVSNRLPIVVKKSGENRYELRESSGGLVTAMTPVLKRDGGVWVGWAGNYEEEGIALETLLRQEEKNLAYSYETVDINLKEYELYYKGFCNEILWPLFHNLSVYCNFKADYYKAFKRVNRKFAKTVTEVLIDNDFIWIHDYHLINTGEELRKSGIQNKIAFFLHIPFPPAETFNRIPWRLQIVKALLAYDLIGFQTKTDKKNFLEVVATCIEEGEINAKMVDSATIVGKKRENRVAVFPISIDYDEFSDAAGSKPVVQKYREIKEGYHGQKIILGVDRLDYSKGIPQRLKAYRTLLKRNPQLHTKVKLIQIMVPSREDIIEYGNLKREIEQMVGEINGRFSRPGWIPIQNCYCTLSREELLAYYRASDIALVTPLKDGMNLVAKEYCVTNIDREGVLILSKFAGVRQQFKNNALSVNPFDEESVVDALKKALFMESDEKHKRMKKMQKNVRKFDIYWWVDAFLQAAKRQEGGDEKLLSADRRSRVAKAVKNGTTGT